MLEVAAIAGADPPAAWRSCGFTVDDDGTCRVGGVRIRLDAPGRGICSWAVRGLAAGVEQVDGLIIEAADHNQPPPATHENATASIDHVVVMSPKPARTVDALVALGFEPRRTREAGEMRQTFFRMGDVILELIGPREPDPVKADRPARFFGIAFTATDLDATAAFLGDRLGAAKDAVQPGRRIATLRREAGLSLAVAFMSPGAAAVP